MVSSSRSQEKLLWGPEILIGSYISKLKEEYQEMSIYFSIWDPPSFL